MIKLSGCEYDFDSHFIEIYSKLTNIISEIYDIIALMKRAWISILFLF